jgi:AraC family transcriptional regulator
MKEVTLLTYKERILRVLVYIQQNLDRELKLEEIARLAYFSSYHFHRIFRGMVGESLQEHIRRLRLERAALRLKNSSTPVTSVAFDAGYGTHESFIRAFRAMFGEAPSRFRLSRKGFAPHGRHHEIYLSDPRRIPPERLKTILRLPIRKHGSHPQKSKNL